MSTPFYDLASLVVVPSGYKSGKIYAQKPLTTDGQLTFTRASTATRVNASGLIESVASGVPRLDYFGSSCPKLQLEPQRSNLTLYSQQIDNAYWNKQNGTISANSTTSPDGTANADLFTENSTNADHAIFDVVSYFVAGTTYTLSFFAKANGRTKIELVSANSGTCPTGRFDLVAKTATATNTSFGAKIEEYGNGWFRCSVSRVAPNTGLDLPYYAMVQSFGTIGYQGDGTSGMYFWGMQTEAGAYATSYIPTTTAAVTRLADAASKTGISSLIGQTEGTMFVEIDTFGFNNFDRFIALQGTTSSDRFLLLRNSPNDRLYFYVEAGGSTVINQAGISGTNVLGRHKIAAAYKSGAYSVYMDGVEVYSSSATSVPAMSQVFLGTSEDGLLQNTMSGGIKQALVFKTRLTNAQLAELTTL